MARQGRESDLVNITGQPQILTWTLSSIIANIANIDVPSEGKVADEDDWLRESIGIVDSATQILYGSKSMQKLAHLQELQQKLSEIIQKDSFAMSAKDEDEDGAEEVPLLEEFKEAIV